MKNLTLTLFALTISTLSFSQSFYGGRVSLPNGKTYSVSTVSVGRTSFTTVSEVHRGGRSRDKSLNHPQDTRKYKYLGYRFNDDKSISIDLGLRRIITIQESDLPKFKDMVNTAYELHKLYSKNKVVNNQQEIISKELGTIQGETLRYLYNGRYKKSVIESQNEYSVLLHSCFDIDKKSFEKMMKLREQYYVDLNEYYYKNGDIRNELTNLNQESAKIIDK